MAGLMSPFRTYNNIHIQHLMNLYGRFDVCKAPESIRIDLGAILMNCIIIITCIHIICIYTVYVMSIVWSIYLKIITIIKWLWLVVINFDYIVMGVLN